MVAVWQSYKKLSGKMQNLVCFFCSHFKSDEEVAFSQKKPQSSKHSSGAVKLSFDETDGNFCRKYENLFSKIGKGKKIYVLFRKKLLKTFPRTRRIPFRQTWRSVFAEKPKYFLVNEMQWSKRLILSKKVFFLKTFIWSPRHQIY